MRIAIAIAALAACVSPSRARYLGGGYASLEDSAAIDSACRRRVSQTAIEPREATAPVIASQPAAVAAPDAALEVDAGPFGRLRVIARPPLSASVPLAQLELRPPQPVRGFLFGVDLRPYKKIAFVVDTGGGTMCEAPRMLIDRASDELVAAISGLPAQTSFVLVGTSSGVRELAPAPGDNGRRAAMQWTCNLFCSGDTSLAMALLAAYAEAPDVVVVLSTDGASYKSGQTDNLLDRDLQLYHADPERIVERMTGAAPIIAIDLGPGSPHLAAIAERTGGIVVRP